MSIGENIRNLRLKHNLSQKDIALIAGVTDKAVSTWEKGIKEPRMGTIQKIADHFGIRKSDLIEDNNDILLSPRDERQIAEDLERMIADLDTQNALAAMGGTVEEQEDRELLKASLLTSMRLAKKLAKEKYTPNKYKE